MAHRPSKSAARQSLGIESLAPDPDDDQGLSLEELGDAYAALLSPERSDPYVEEDAAQPEEEAQDDDRPLRVLTGSDDEACEITPRTIVEAMLFVGNPLG